MNRPLPPSHAKHEGQSDQAYQSIARAAVTWSFRPRLGLTLIGDNLLDQQTGEPDNVTVPPGRTISVGLRVTP